MRILVAQMTRMGDMIQTTPLLRALRRLHPESHITAMVRTMSKAICEQNPDINDVIVYDEDEMFLHLCAQDSDRLLRAYEGAEAYIRLLKEGRYDVCYNCTHSIASAMLFKLAEIPEVIGAHLSDDWQFVLRGRWVNYFFASVFYRQYNALNLCDIMRHFAVAPVSNRRLGHEDTGFKLALSAGGAPECRELMLGVSDADRAFVSALFAEHGIGSDDFVVCFQLGASENKKRWSEDRFAALGRMLAEQKKARIFLLGVKDEVRHGEAFAQHAPGRTIPLFGMTTVAQVAALLERSRFLVTNDTGTMHIAAAVRCPVVLVSIGHVHFRETGPYGEGHYAIERRRNTLGPADWSPSGIDEHRQVDPAHVCQTIEHLLDANRKGPITQLDAADFTDVDVHISRFAPDGCLEWYPALRRPLDQQDFTRIAYRAMWLEFLREKSDPRAEKESLAQLLGCFDIPLGAISGWRKELETRYDGLAELARRGSRKTEQLIQGLTHQESMRKAKDLVTELTRLDDEIRLYGDLHEPCKPLTLMARYERGNLEGADPLHLARTTLQIYRDLFARARLMTAKLEAVTQACHDLK